MAEKTNHQQSAIWAADCAVRALPLLEAEHPTKRGHEEQLKQPDSGKSAPCPQLKRESSPSPLIQPLALP
jgi:hypothetical protein